MAAGAGTKIAIKIEIFFSPYLTKSGVRQIGKTWILKDMADQTDRLIGMALEKILDFKN